MRAKRMTLIPVLVRVRLIKHPNQVRGGRDSIDHPGTAPTAGCDAGVRRLDRGIALSIVARGEHDEHYADH